MQKMPQTQQIPSKKRKNISTFILIILLITVTIEFGLINFYMCSNDNNSSNSKNDTNINKLIDKAVQDSIDKYFADLDTLMVNAIIKADEVITAEEITEDNDINAEDMIEETSDSSESSEKATEVENETEIEIDEINRITLDNMLIYVDSPYYESDIPILINRDNYIPEDYNPDLVYIDNSNQLNAKAESAFNDMLAASKKDGINIWVVSAYRSHARQTNNFNNNVNILVSQGLNQYEACIQTARYIAVPGTSEHEAGLAIDFNLIEERFDQTREYIWLINNCTDFGFILRYQKNTEPITKIAYEPWHYRYVGINHAKKIVELGLTLDEYVAELKKYE